MPEVTVTARQPLSLGTRPRAGAPAPTFLYIPGWTLRGALAKVWLAQHDVVSGSAELPTDFLELFERNVRFGPLFASGSTVVPLSVLRCKYRPADDCAAEHHDEAFGANAVACGHCGGPLVRGRGEVESFGNVGGLTSRTTRVALTPAETAADGALHTRDSIRHRDALGRPREFTGRIIGGGEWLLHHHRLLLGGRRSTSGAVDYHARPDSPAAPPTELTGRRLVVRLLTPAALVDDAGRPTADPSETLLSELLGVRVSVDRRWVRRSVLGGWNQAADLPKPDEHVVTPGSTYALDLHDDPDPTAVAALVDRGIGLRRVEGLGWISVSRWQPPRTGAAAQGVPYNETVDRMSEMLVSLKGDHARWFASELRAYLVYLHGGGTPHTDLLRRPRLQTLPPRERRNINLLLSGGRQDLISSVVELLDARIRGVLK